MMICTEVAVSCVMYLLDVCYSCGSWARSVVIVTGVRLGLSLLEVKLRLGRCHCWWGEYR